MRRWTTSIGVAVLVLAAAGAVPFDLAAQAPLKKKLTLERLYSWPRLEGRAPIQAKWAADSRRLAFLWNDKGMSFRDLWLYDAEARKLTRLTNLDQPRDEWTESPAEKDPKLKKYLPPDSGLGGFEWAPDSRQIAFAFRGELYVVEVESGRLLRLTKTKEPEFRPRFSPDSQKLAFSSERELWVLDLSTGQRVQLSSGGSDDLLNGAPPFPQSTARLFEWSPDGAWIAFQQIDRSGEPTRLIPNYAGDQVTVRRQRRTFAQDETPRIRLGVVPAAGGTVVWLTRSERQYYYDWKWSPDSIRIALNRVEENWKRRHLDVVDVAAALEAGTKAQEGKGAEAKTPAWLRTVYSESDDKWVCTICDFVEWSPDGRRLLFSSERDGWNHLYLIGADAPAGTDPRQLTRGPWEVETRGFPLEMRPRFDRSGLFVYFTANKEDWSRRDFYAVLVQHPPAMAFPDVVRLTNREGYNAGLVSPDDRRIALLFSSFAEPWDLYLGWNAELCRDAMVEALKRGEDWKRVTASPLPEFEEYEWPQPKIVEFPAQDGKTVRALLFSPTEMMVRMHTLMRRPGPPREERTKGGRARVEPVPVINFVHGAGYAQAVLNRWGGYATERFQFNQFLAQYGYAVIDVDYRGSSGYGRDWRTDVYLHLGGRDLDDELAAMDYLKKLGWVDTDRAGIWGVSYGGFMTLMAMFRSPDTFKAGSAWAAVTDWENYQRHYTQQRLRTPKEEPGAYQGSSPIHHVAGLKNALQIQHGMVDDNVHFQDAAQLLDALVAAGKEFDLVVYPESSHGWVRPSVWIHSTRRMFNFFERHLKPR